MGKLVRHFSYLKKFKFLVLCFLIFTSCSPNSVYLQEAPNPRGQFKVKGSVKFSQAVDILFVIDDSGSMAGYQDKLKTNISLYLAEMAKSSALDYHIGVVTTSSDYPSSVPGQSGNLVRKEGSNIYFVQKSTPNGLKTLEDMLYVGTSGSPSEKMFDPVYLALSRPAVSGMNRGFYRQNAYLAVIFLTDAEDQSTLISSPEMLYTFLLGLKNNDSSKILIYGAVVPVASGDRSSCARDPDGLPIKVERFFDLANSFFNESWFDICSSNYGPKLAQLAKTLVRKVSKYIYLDQVPDILTLKVRYGKTELQNDSQKGWTFDPSRNAVVLSDHLDWEKLTKDKAGQIEVDFTPADISIK